MFNTVVALIECTKEKQRCLWSAVEEAEDIYELQFSTAITP
jgi:hypothetical protein